LVALLAATFHEEFTLYLGLGLASRSVASA
jgi:hypothetical protein